MSRELEVKHYKVLSLSSNLDKNAVYYLFDQNTGKVKAYITTKDGIPIPLIDLTTIGSVLSVTGTGVSGTAQNPKVDIATFVSSQLGNQVYLSLSDGKLQVNPITSPDNSIEVTSTSSELQIQLSAAIQAQINSALQPGANISELTNDVGYLTLADIDATDLSYTPSATNGTVNSSTGTDAIIPLAGALNAGLLSPSEKSDIASAIQPSELATVATTGDYVDLINIPTEFTPEAHTHPISDVINLQSSLDGKVDENAPITSGTFTKITYDVKGLVTNGADATTADINDSTDRRYVTDADLVDIGNLSGVNTGDQNSIVGISGTKTEFNSELTDGDFLFVGDITQYTDESAQDAVGGILADTDTVDLSYNDGLNTISADVKPNSIDATHLADDINISEFVNDSSFETTTQLDVRDTNNRNRANHTGTQLSSTISDFDTAARVAAVENSITDGVINKAPSENAVFDALALKADVTYVNSQDASTLASANAYSDSLVVGLWDDRGTYDASVNLYPSTGGSGTAGAILKGDIWTISVEGVIDGYSIKTRQTVRALIDAPGQTSSNWAIGLADPNISDAIVDGVISVAPSQNAVYDALELKTTLSAGAFSGFELTNNGNGTVNIASGIAYLRATNDPYATIIKYPITAVTNLALTDNANNYVLVDYNGGSPTITVTINASTINTQTNSLAYVIARVGNDLEYLSLVGQNVDPNAKLRIRFLNQEGIRRASGAVLGFSSRNLTLTSSVLFSGLIRINAAAFNTASPDTFTLAYNNGSTWTRTVGQTQVNNTQYNVSGTLTTMPNNTFRTDYVYLLPNNPSKLYVVMGTTTYGSLTLAKGAPRPSSLPVELQVLGLEVGRLFIEKSNASIAEVQSTFANEFVGAQVPEHNSLSGLQGGTAGEYNHLTNAQVALVDSVPLKAPIASPTFTGTVTAPIINTSQATTATAFVEYFGNTGDDVVKPKTLANTQTEIVTTAAVDAAKPNILTGAGAVNRVPYFSSSSNLTSSGSLVFDPSVNTLSISNSSTSTFRELFSGTSSVDPLNGAVRFSLSTPVSGFQFNSYGSTVPGSLANGTSIVSTLGTGLVLGAHLGASLKLYSNNNFITPQVTLHSSGNFLVGTSTNNGNIGRFAGTVDANKLQLNTTPATASGTPPLLTWNSSTKDVESVPYDTFAPIASPAFTGTPTAPTATAGTNTTQIATTAFVYQSMPFKGTYTTTGAATTTFTVSIGRTMANTSYVASPVPTNTLSAVTFSVQNKTTTTFDIVIVGAGLTGTVAYDFIVTP